MPPYVAALLGLAALACACLLLLAHRFRRMQNQLQQQAVQAQAQAHGTAGAMGASASSPVARSTDGGLASPFSAAALLPAFSSPGADDSCAAAGAGAATGSCAAVPITPCGTELLSAMRVCSRAADACEAGGQPWQLLPCVSSPTRSSTGDSQMTLPPFLAARAGSPSRAASSRCSEAAALPRADSLPTHLREWLVEPGALSYVRGPTGGMLELGRGATGVVVKARLRGESVAAKIVDIGRGPQEREAFLVEASRLAQLRHPNLPVLYGLALTASKGVIVQELCEGRDLRSSLQLTVRGGDGPAARVFGWHRAGPRVAHDIVKALSYMHARGVCHADVKAANVLLTEHGQAKLADVAFSCRLGSSSGSAGQPRCGTAAAASSDAGVELSASFLGASRPVGTFAWIAPESLLGEPPSAAADVYSLGVVLHEIITGELPKRGQLRMPRMPEECDEQARDLMLSCLRLDPAERPTARELLHTLGKLRARRGSTGAADPQVCTLAAAAET